METTKENPQRLGLKSGVRTEFTVFGNVKPGQEKAVHETIVRGQRDPRGQEAFHSIGTLHEARFVLFDNDTRVLFCSSFDGTWDKYIDDFAATAIGPIFDAVWSHTEGYPGIQHPSVKDWFMSHAVEATSFNSDYPDATVKEIRKALDVQHAFQQVLDDPAAEEALKSPALKPLLDQAAT
jgi:hypothetical protein